MYTSDLEIVRLSNIFLYGSWILISLKSLISSFHNDKNKYTYVFSWYSYDSTFYS